jgi:soluble lytic murein transglycosylase-like protein
MACLSAALQTRKKGYAMCNPINGCLLSLLIIFCLVNVRLASLNAGASARVQEKLNALSASSASKAPGTGSLLSQLPASGSDSVELAQQDVGIPPQLLVRQINQEHGFNLHDVSWAEARGITQFMFDTKMATAPFMRITPYSAEWLSYELEIAQALSGIFWTAH